MNDSDTIETLGDKYRSLDRHLPARGVEAIDTGCLLTFPYPDDGAPQEVVIDTDELTATLVGNVRPIWDRQLRHPFVQALGDGTLPRENFVKPRCFSPGIYGLHM